MIAIAGPDAVPARVQRRLSYAGLVILSRVVRRRWFKAGLDEFATIGAPVNRVREVNLADAVRLTLYELPSG